MYKRQLHALCTDRGIFYLHVLQPTLLDPGSKPLTERERTFLDVEEALVQGVRLGYPRLRAAAARLREHGIAFADASGVFRETPGEIYDDACHFQRPGTELLGEAVGAAFLRELP